jgi:hypothetical protein
VQLRDTLTDLVEVYGTVDERGNWINCINYATFHDDLITNFGIV